MIFCLCFIKRFETLVREYRIFFSSYYYSITWIIDFLYGSFFSPSMICRWNMIYVWVSMTVISQIVWQLEWIEVGRKYRINSGEWRMPLPISTQSCLWKLCKKNSCFKSLEIYSNWHCWINNYACDRFFCNFMSKTFMIYLKMFFFSSTIFSFFDHERKRQSLMVWNWATSPLFESEGFEVNT